MRWNQLEDEMSAGLDEEFAEPVNHIPMARPDVNARWGEDPARPRQMFDAGTCRPSAIFEQLPKVEYIGKGQDQTRATPATSHSTRLPMLYADVSQFDSPIQVGDRIALVERDQAYAVVDVQPDGHGRIAVQLNQLGLAGQGSSVRMT